MNDLFKTAWQDSIEYDRIKCKVDFYNSCNIFKKLLFFLIHGRRFVPNNNERHLCYLTEKYKRRKRK